MTTILFPNLSTRFAAMPSTANPAMAFTSFVRASFPKGGRRRGNVEMYQTGRYFIMTGNDAAGYADIVDCTETIKPLHEKYIGAGREPTTGVKVVH